MASNRKGILGQLHHGLRCLDIHFHRYCREALTDMRLLRMDVGIPGSHYLVPSPSALRTSSKELPRGYGRRGTSAPSIRRSLLRGPTATYRLSTRRT